MPCGALGFHCCDNFQLKMSLAESGGNRERPGGGGGGGGSSSSVPERTRLGAGESASHVHPSSYKAAPTGPKLINKQRITHTAETETNSYMSPKVKK